jgi:hypothetical protein
MAPLPTHLKGTVYQRVMVQHFEQSWQLCQGDSVNSGLNIFQISKIFQILIKGSQCLPDQRSRSTLLIHATWL